MIAEFSLRPGVHVATSGSLFIFLDEHHDRYLALPPLQCDLFRDLAKSHLGQKINPETLAFAYRLVDLGLLSKTSMGNPLLTLESEQAQSSNLLKEDIGKELGTVAPGDIVSFSRSLIRCWHLHRYARLSFTLTKARRWKAAVTASAKPHVSAVALTQTFNALSPYFISTHDECRFRSLLLFRFLTIRGGAADWVFGVRTAPFAAHCWLESGMTVLNDHAENIAQYSEILRI